ncbi:MAG: hypothetical protein IKX88_16915, partial [Thermoguttaceae bacterium]|nr:hypothetical protein [Thermoguttaceae bacterium]
PLVTAEQQKAINEELNAYDLTKGAGPLLRRLFIRGVGVHHAGILPKYRRIVESLFQKKLLAFCICTETLAAGINLPARSVVLPTLMKGPSGDKKLVEPSTAQQIFGRAGRPQYDATGYVFALAHPDDVKIAKKRAELESIPEDTKDPKLLRERRKRKANLPKRSPNVQYWGQKQFEYLRDARPSVLTSRGYLPWRLLAHMIESNSDVRPIRTLVARRLMSAKRLEIMQKSLDQMLLTLWRGGFVRLAPNPESYGIPGSAEATAALLVHRRNLKEKKRRSRPFGVGIFDESFVNDASNDATFDPKVFEAAKSKVDEPAPEPKWELPEGVELPEGFDFFGGDDLFNLDDFGNDDRKNNEQNQDDANDEEPFDEEEPDELPALTFGTSGADVRTQSTYRGSKQEPPKDFDINTLREDLRDRLAATYKASRAYPTPKIKILTSLRGVNPVYGAFLLEQLGIADRWERIQAFESLLETPTTVARHLRVPKYEILPPGALANARLDKELLQKGLASAEELIPRTEEQQREYWERKRMLGDEFEPVYLLGFAEKLRRLFDYQYPGVHVRVTPVWAAGEMIGEFNGDFNKFVLSKGLVRQEGVVFRHLLRLILLIQEFIPLEPKEGSATEWREDLEDVMEKVIASCRAVDPSCVEETLNFSKKTDPLDRT